MSEKMEADPFRLDHITVYNWKMEENKNVKIDKFDSKFEVNCLMDISKQSVLYNSN